MLPTEKETGLPVTPKELDAFVERITTKFKLPRTESTYEAIATAIMHLPAHVGHVKLSYLAGCARKYLANHAAYPWLEEKAKARAAEEKAKNSSKELVQIGPKSV